MRRREPENQPHGRAATYRNHGCRCADCREAQRVAVAEYKQRRRAGHDFRPYRRRATRPARRSLKLTTDTWPGAA